MSLSQRFKGWRTVVAARVYAVVGFAVTAHDYLIPYITGVDWSPITEYFPRWSIPVFIFGTWILFDFLRHITDTEIGKSE